MSIKEDGGTLGVFSPKGVSFCLSQMSITVVFYNTCYRSKFSVTAETNASDKKMVKIASKVNDYSSSLSSFLIVINPFMVHLC